MISKLPLPLRLPGARADRNPGPRSFPLLGAGVLGAGAILTNKKKRRKTYIY